MADLPSDFDGEVSCDVQAVSTSAPTSSKEVKNAKKTKKVEPVSSSEENVDYLAPLAK